MIIGLLLFCHFPIFLSQTTTTIITPNNPKNAQYAISQSLNFSAFGGEPQNRCAFYKDGICSFCETGFQLNA